MSSNTNIGNTPVNQGYVQLIHTGETGGIDGTLRTLYDGDGTASDLQIASNKVKVSTELYIGSKTATEFIQDIVGDMFTTGSYTNITTTYDDTNGNIDLSASGEVTLTGTQTLSNKTLASPTFTGTANGVNLTLSGDLTVNGTTTTVNQTNLDVSDNIIGLNRGASSNANDSGLIIERGSTGDNVFIGWDESADRVVFGVTSATPDSTGNLTIVNQPIQAARLYGDVTGNVTGSASLNLLKSSNLSDLASASTARTNLGVAIGSDVQAYNSTLASVAGGTYTGDDSITTLGTIGTGVWQGTAIASAYLDADTAHLSGTQTFSGAKTFSSIITGSITGNAGTATKWANPRQISLTGDITGVTGASGLDGSADVSIATTIANDSVALGAQTTGNYMENVSAGTGISVSHTPSEGSTATISTNDSAIVHNNLNGYVANEHIDWTTDQGAINIHAGNYTDTNQLTTFVIQDGDTTNVTISQGKYVKFQALTNGGLDIDWASSLGAGSSGDPYDLQFKIDLSNMGALVDTLESGDNLLVYNADEGTALAPVSEIQSALNIPSASGTTDGVVTLNANGTLTGESNLTFDGSTGLLLLNQDSNAEAFRVTGGGGGNKIASFIRDVGVASPYAETYIHAGGADPQITFRSSANQYFSMGIDLSASSFKISENTGVGTNDRLTIDTSGNVGIGTASPGYKLSVENELNVFSSGDTASPKVEGHLLRVTDTTNDNPDIEHFFVENHGLAYGMRWLYDGGANTFSLFRHDNSASGNEVLRFNRANSNVYIPGNVGIGTTSPDGKLNIDVNTSAALGQNDDASNYSFVLNCTPGSSTGHIERHIGFRDPGGDVVSAINAVDDGGSGATGITFATGNTTTLSEKMRIDSSGNVGIGTTSPSNPLHINNSYPQLRLQTTDDNTYTTFGSGTGFMVFNIVNPATNTYEFRNNGTAQLTIDTSGNVGIGTNSPGYLLHLSGTAPELAFTDTDGSATWRARAVTNNFHITETGAGDPFVIQSGAGANALVINSSGNVGIGGSPEGNAKLDIKMSGVSQYLKLERSSSTGRAQIQLANESGTELWRFGLTGGGSEDFEFWDGSFTHLKFDRSANSAYFGGNVGIGVASPGVKLDVAGQARSTNGMLVDNGTTAGFFTTDSDNVNFGASTSGKGLRLFSANAEAMRIDSSGNVGIGIVPKTGGSTWQHIQFGGTGNLIARKSDTTIDSMFANNYYVNSSNVDSYITTGAAARMFLNDNEFNFDQAASGSTDAAISFTTAMKIDALGDVKITESLGIGVNASSTTGRLDCSNDVVAFSTSDKRLKENIKPLDSALDKVLKISGVEFDWKPLNEEEKKTIHGNEGHDVGVIAQEIEKVLPEVVTTRDSGYKAVKYEKIVPLLIEAIKEQQKQIEELKNG